jgi:peptidoglycan/LPS O-acetylase OafA/YrhL
MFQPMYRNLDVLRAFAVFHVFLCHIVLMSHPLVWIARIALGLGRLGVILFFFHTSFVLMQSLEALHPNPLWPVRFYVRRIFRIYPLAILVVLGAVALQTPFAPWDSMAPGQPGLRTLAANLLLVQNLVGSPGVISPLWSLPLEVQMYAVLPLIFVLVRRTGWKAAMVGMWVLAAVCAGAVYSLTHHLGFFAFIPCFLSGVTAYKITRSVQPVWHSSTWIPIILVITAAGVAVSLKVPAEWAVCLGLALIFPRVRDMEVNRITRVSHVVAKYSYGIYLFHLFALWLSFGAWAFSGSIAVRILLAVAIVAVTSFASFHLVEDPFIRAGKKLADGLVPAHAARVSGSEVSAHPL